MTERCIRSLNNGLRVFSTEDINDTQLEVILPLIQTFIRASVNPDTRLSPFENFMREKCHYQTLYLQRILLRHVVVQTAVTT